MRVWWPGYNLPQIMTCVANERQDGERRRTTGGHGELSVASGFHNVHRKHLRMSLR